MAYQRWWKTVRDQQGNAVNGASCTVFEAGTSATATIYDPNSNDLTPSPIANPFITTANGLFGFMAEDGEYDVKISGGALATQQYRVSLNTLGQSADNLRSDLSEPTGASLVGWLAPFTGAVARTLDAILGGISISPMWFGAVGDGVTDDTIALRCWLRAFGGIHDLGGEGRVYLVKPQTVGEVILPLDKGIFISGSGATIKVANSSGGFYSIIGSSDAGIDLTNTRISGVIFDHNGGNNTYDSAANVLVHPHLTFSALNGSDIVFSGNKVINPVCTNSVYINGVSGGVATVKRPVVCDNVFWEVGGSPTAHDHSTIYLVGDEAIVSGNTGSASSLGGTGAACFIELHATKITAYANKAFGYDGFMNMTGIYSGGDTEHSQVFGNVCETLQFGIRCFSTTSGLHTSGYGINGLDIFSNKVRIRQSQLTSGTSRLYIGVGVQTGTTLPVNNLRIFNNSVEYDLESVAPSYNAISGAVGVMEASNNTTFENVEIVGNTIINSPGPAIMLGFNNGTYLNCFVCNNLVKNPGQSQSLSLAPYRAGVWLGGNLYSGSLKIVRLFILEDNLTTRTQYGIYASPILDSTTCTMDVEADITITGDGVSFLRSFANVGNKTLPLFTGRINKTPLFTSHTFLVGSQISDITNGVNYRVQVQGGTWTDHGFATTTPASGTHQIGSTRVNTSPSASGNFGWVCTVSGTPGTWKTYGAISA